VTSSFTDLYVQVQQFYAGQVQHLDAMRADEFAATFTKDAVFDHSPGNPPFEGREAIADEMRSYQQKRYAENPAQRRHWFHMLRVLPQDDGSIVSEYYAMLLMTKPGEPLAGPAMSYAVRDVLVFEAGELLTRERRVVPDAAR
jgi:actinorhodin biosynthesis protein ActVIA